MRNLTNLPLEGDSKEIENKRIRLSKNGSRR